jgi:hypothetical protein
MLASGKRSSLLILSFTEREKKFFKIERKKGKKNSLSNENFSPLVISRSGLSLVQCRHLAKNKIIFCLKSLTNIVVGAAQIGVTGMTVYTNLDAYLSR